MCWDDFSPSHRLEREYGVFVSRRTRMFLFKRKMIKMGGSTNHYLVNLTCCKVYLYRDCWWFSQAIVEGLLRVPRIRDIPPALTTN